MKKIVCLMLLSFSLSLTAFGQQSMSDTQVLQYVMQQKKMGKAESEIAQELLKKGATLEQIQNMRQKYAKQLEQSGMGQAADQAIGDATDRMRKNNGALREVETDPKAQQMRRQQMMQNRPDSWLYGDDMSMYQSPDSVYFGKKEEGKKVFGRDIFNNKSLTFEPVMNIATPQNYVLGPGDQVIIDVYGDTQKSEQLTVSPDGNVTVPGYGPIHVSGLSVASAHSQISKKLGTYYESSQIKVTVSRRLVPIPSVPSPPSSMPSIWRVVSATSVRSVASRSSARVVRSRWSMSMSSSSMDVWQAMSACRTMMSSR